jgi:hypothetical protein
MACSTGSGNAAISRKMSDKKTARRLNWLSISDLNCADRFGLRPLD